MKSLFSFLALLAFAGMSFALAPGERSISNIPGATESLLRIVSPKFYQTLLLSPVEGWIVARGWLSGNRLAGSRIIHSELNGRYDALALELANNLNVLGLAPEQSSRPPPVLVHVLIYQIANGTLALSFAHSDEVGGSQIRYYGAAWMAVQKPNHLWVTIEPLRPSTFDRRGPKSYTLLGVRPGAVGLPRAVGRVRRLAR